MSIELRSTVKIDDITKEATSGFDFDFTGETVTKVQTFTPPKKFGVGLIVGASGSGKSTLLRHLFGNESVYEWDANKSVAGHFASADDAIDRLGGVGLNTIPAWCRQYQTLSTGEKFRADMAIRLADGAVFDEFTSTVNRTVAKSCARSIARYIKAKDLTNIVFASCHHDIIEWLEPDWVYNTDRESFISTRGRLRRPSISVEIERCKPDLWRMFSRHHYLTSSINRAARCWIGRIHDEPICFLSALAFPSGNWKNGWREHRTVVLPDYQGLGIGVRASDAIAEHFVLNGARYFSKTSHPRMGEYRERSMLWRATSKNKRARPDYKASRDTKEKKHKHRHINRVCYSHEYIGNV